MNIQARLMEVDDLCTEIGRSSLRVVDCRFDLMNPDKGRNDYLRGHIPGAIYADLNRDLAAPIRAESGRHPLPDPTTFVAWLGESGINRTSDVVVYDQRNGAVAARLWWMLAWQGHSRVWLLNGGLDQWVRAGLGLEPGEVTAPPTEFVGATEAGSAVTSDELTLALAQGRMPILVDARSADRFHGRSEPIDTVAGHIPGAVNFPFECNLDAEGRWLSPAHIRRQWDKLITIRPESRCVAMCGSGVTACHLVFSARYAGIAEPQLYVGSWSEWIRDPGRPIAITPD